MFMPQEINVLLEAHSQNAVHEWSSTGNRAVAADQAKG